MTNCPKCNSTEVEILQIDILDLIEKDATTKYYLAIYRAECLSCGNLFEFEDNYTEVE